MATTETHVNPNFAHLNPEGWAEHLTTCPDPMNAYMRLREYRMEHDLIWWLLERQYPDRTDRVCSAARDEFNQKWLTT